MLKFNAYSNKIIVFSCCFLRLVAFETQKQKNYHKTKKKKTSFILFFFIIILIILLLNDNTNNIYKLLRNKKKLDISNALTSNIRCLLTFTFYFL